MTAAELRARRLALGLSQNALCRRLIVGVTTVSRWENGHQPIPPYLELAIRCLEYEQAARNA